MVAQLRASEHGATLLAALEALPLSVDGEVLLGACDETVLKAIEVAHPEAGLMRMLDELQAEQAPIRVFGVPLYFKTCLQAAGQAMQHTGEVPKKGYVRLPSVIVQVKGAGALNDGQLDQACAGIGLVLRLNAVTAMRCNEYDVVQGAAPSPD